MCIRIGSVRLHMFKGHWFHFRSVCVCVYSVYIFGMQALHMLLRMYMSLVKQHVRCVYMYIHIYV